LCFVFVSVDQSLKAQKRYGIISCSVEWLLHIFIPCFSPFHLLCPQAHGPHRFVSKWIQQNLISHSPLFFLL
jgi:hypothetical protein